MLRRPVLGRPIPVGGGRAFVLLAGDPPPAPPDRDRTPAEVGRVVGAGSDDVLVAVLAGTLDGVAVDPAGELRLASTKAALHRAFPEHARRVVAAREGWPVEETVTVPELRRLRGET